MKRMAVLCPKCGSRFKNLLAYGYSSWLFSVKCKTCESKLYLGYNPLAFIILWFFLSPVICLGIVIAGILIFPPPFTLPGMFLLFFPVPLLLIPLGIPRLKDDQEKPKGLFRKTPEA